MRIERTANGSQSGIWALAWNPHPEDGHDLLCVADWAQTISFYSLSGKQVRLFFIIEFMRWFHEFCNYLLASRLDLKISIKSKKEHFKPKIYIFLTFMLIKFLVRTLQGINTETLFVLPMKI